jgi:uncharacterized OsmC-like protein
MTDIQTSTVSEEGFTCKSQVGEFELTIDATNENGPNPNDVLVADYASCFLPAFRVGGQRTGHDDLGKIQIDADATLNDDDDLTSISFTLYVEADLSDEEFDEIVEKSEGICHVHTALREELEADVEVHGDAF